MSTPTTASRAPVRRRRLIIIVATLVSLLFFYSVLPPSLRDAGLHWSRANLYPTKADSEALKVDEIYGLLYMVTENEEHVLTDLPESDFSAPLNMTVYTGREEINWPKMVKRLNKKYPLVVFSKSYCPYSRRAKKLLESYRIRPAPKVIEVDLRPDGHIIKSILSRLTQHQTFPNIILRGRTIGGSDDLQFLHEHRSLAKVLEQAGAVVRETAPSSR